MSAPITFIVVCGKPEHHASAAAAEVERDRLHKISGRRHRVMKVLNVPGSQATAILRDMKNRRA